MMRWFTAHIELKAVALVLAVALWVYTSGQARVERTLTVVIDHAAALTNAGMVVASISQPRFSVVVSVPSERLETLSEIIEPRLDLRGSATAIAVPVTSRTLGLDSEVRIVRTDPPGLRLVHITLEAKENIAVTLRQPQLVGVPPSHSARVIFDPPTVRMRATTAIAQRLRRDGLRPLSATVAVPADLIGERSERVIIAFAAEPGLEVPEPLTAMVVLSPRTDGAQTIVLPVHMALAPELLEHWRIVPSQTRVEATIYGPAALLRGLSADTIAAYGVITAAMPIPRNGGVLVVPVRVVGPPWLRADPATAAIQVAALGQLP